MAPLRFAVIGTGFWSNFQIPAWLEVGGVELVAVSDQMIEKAKKVAQKLNVPKVYGDPEELIKSECLDFVDIITEVDSHAPLVKLAAKYHLPVICQKPMAPDLFTAEEMVEACRKAETPFFIHENWRWQTPIRAVKAVLSEKQIGKPYRAQIEWLTGFNPFFNQPTLKKLPHLILADMGCHLLDISRVLFGEADTLYCQTKRVNPDLSGEDAATIVLNTDKEITVTINMAYALTPVERECFPQTCIFIEAEKGSLFLGPDYWLRITTREGTFSRRIPPPRFAWSDPAYEVIHSSIVPCNADLLAGLLGKKKAETTAEDNLITTRLVFAAYDSAATGEVIRI
jgi:predicted dehydrogenase